MQRDPARLLGMPTSVDDAPQDRRHLRDRAIAYSGRRQRKAPNGRYRVKGRAQEARRRVRARYPNCDAGRCHSLGDRTPRQAAGVHRQHARPYPRRWQREATARAHLVQRGRHGPNRRARRNGPQAGLPPGRMHPPLHPRSGEPALECRGARSLPEFRSRTTGSRKPPRRHPRTAGGKAYPRHPGLRGPQTGSRRQPLSSCRCAQFTPATPPSTRPWVAALTAVKAYSASVRRTVRRQVSTPVCRTRSA